MSLALRLTTVAAALVVLSASGQTRVASDFELLQMEAQAARATDYLSQLSAHLNLGDVRATRGEAALARAEYERARSLSEGERSVARRASTLGRYATATAYAGLAEARLGRAAEAFDLLEEAVRYSSDSGRIWNLYSTAMSALNLPAKAVASARNAVAIAEREVASGDSAAHRLDLAVYQYALASSLLDDRGRRGSPAEPGELLRKVIASLQAPQFQPLRDEIARAETFEIYSTARGDASSYISLLNRTHLRLARLYEGRGEGTTARAEYAAVLSARNDDPIALAAMARLSETDETRQRYFAEAFDANPFSFDLIRSYEKFIAATTVAPPDERSTGARVRLLLQELGKHRSRVAASVLAELTTGNEGNEVLAYLGARAAIEGGEVVRARSLAERLARSDLRVDLSRRLEAAVIAAPSFLATDESRGFAPGEVKDPAATDLRALIRLVSTSAIRPEEREALDRLQFSSVVTMAAGQAGPDSSTTIFASGAIGEISFRFQSPTAFRGSFDATRPLRLSYRILGVTATDKGDELLLEPLRLEPLP